MFNLRSRAKTPRCTFLYFSSHDIIMNFLRPVHNVPQFMRQIYSQTDLNEIILDISRCEFFVIRKACWLSSTPSWSCTFQKRSSEVTPADEVKLVRGLHSKTESHHSASLPYIRSFGVEQSSRPQLEIPRVPPLKKKVINRMSKQLFGENLQAATYDITPLPPFRIKTKLATSMQTFCRRGAVSKYPVRKHAFHTFNAN